MAHAALSGEHKDKLFREDIMVGVKGFEPSASWSRTKRSTKLSYTPLAGKRLSLEMGPQVNTEAPGPAGLC